MKRLGANAAPVDLAAAATEPSPLGFAGRGRDHLAAHAGMIPAARAAPPARNPSHGVVRSVFVGRETELRALSGEVARASAGEGRVVLAVGEEGIGKTSLAIELGRLARARGCTVLWGQCHEAAGAPAYWPWTQILRGYVDTADLEALREDLGANAAAVGWITPTLRDRLPDLPAPDTTELTRFHVVDGVIQFLKRVAVRAPLVLVIDDLHHVDGDSLHLLRLFAAESADVPLLVLGTYRDRSPGSPVVAEIARVASGPRTTVLCLVGFEAAEVRRYVEEATAVRPSGALAQAIHAKTEGNPLFVAELTRLLATEGRLSEQPLNGEFRLAIPATRRQAIAERLARLSERCRKLLDAAAVIGRDFDSDLLGCVAGEASSTVATALDEARAARLVCARDDERGSYRFAHVLVREVLYDDLAAGERRRLHGRVAETLEAPSTADGAALLGHDLPLAAIAHHCLEAAMGEDELRRALGWVMAAGRRAAAMMAHEEARRCYEKALSVSESAHLAPPADLSALLVKVAEARWCAGDMNGAREAGRRALVVAKETGEPTAAATAALAFAGRLPGFGAVVSEPEVVTELEQALALLPSTATALRAQVMARLAEELAYAPRGRAERSLGQQAIELARGLGDSGVLAAVLRTTQWSVWTPDAVERRPRLASEIVTLADQTGDRVLALDGELLRLWSALECGETDVAWRQLALCTRLAGDLRLPHYVWVTAAARACLHIATGRLDEAERLAEEAGTVGERSGNPTVALFVGVQREHVRFLRGRWDEVVEWLRSVLAGFSVLAPAVECTLIFTYALVGQHERVRTELARLAADDFARVPRDPAWLMNMTSLAAACTMIGDARRARQLYPHLAPFTPYNVVVPPALVAGPVSHYIGGLAALMGDDAAARRHYEETLALEARTGSCQWTARTQIAYGRLLGRSAQAGDAERGARLVASGRAIAEELGLAPVVREADAGVEPELPPEPARVVFRQTGDAWEVAFRGRRATVPHRVGMSYLRCLLERPGVPVAAIELASLGGDAVLVDHGGGPLLDRQAMREVQRRIADIDAEVAACSRRSAVASADLLGERAECETYLKGRRREIVSASERARSGVTKAIGRAIEAIRGAHEGLAHHLDRRVETGHLCVYVPDPAAPLVFDL